MTDRKLKVLIAEDDEMVQILYQRHLDDALFEKTMVGDGNSALETFIAWAPDILILDIMMPGQSGYTTLKEIRSREKEQGVGPDRQAVIVVASSLTDREDIALCREQGIQGYLKKPFNRVELEELLFGAYRSVYPR